MNIDDLEDRLQKVDNVKITSILELLIEAARDYPSYGLDDIFNYFKEVEKVLETPIISENELEKYLNKKKYDNDETIIWRISSLGLFYEAFGLMKLYKISFEEIKTHIRNLEKNL